MLQNNIFRWRTGRGLIVLAGGGDPNSEDNLSITANLLSHTLSQGPIAYIWAASNIEQADLHMDLLRDLGARTGYLVDILTEEDDALARQLNEAGVIILGEGPSGERLQEALVGVALQAIEDAYRRGDALRHRTERGRTGHLRRARRDPIGRVQLAGWLDHSLAIRPRTPSGCAPGSTSAQTVMGWAWARARR